MVVTSFCNLAPEQGEHLTFWGQGPFSSFSGEEKGFSLNGYVTTLLLGADWSTARWQAGAALSQSWAVAPMGEPTMLKVKSAAP